MAEYKTPENIELGSFFEIAGKSLADAQNTLLSGLNISSNVVLNNADLEVKVTVDSEQGKLMVRPVSSEEIRIGSIDPGLLSTLRISYVSTLEETPLGTVTEAPPASKKEPSQLVEQVLNRKDIQKLVAARGELQVKPTFVAERSRWLVSVEDKSGRVLREIVMPD